MSPYYNTHKKKTFTNFGGNTCSVHIKVDIFKPHKKRLVTSLEGCDGAHEKHTDMNE